MLEGTKGSPTISAALHCWRAGDSSFVAIPVSRAARTGDRLHPTEASRNVHRLLEESMTLWLITLALQHPMRGGIEFGIGLQWGENEVYGDALSEAYRLESKLAERPRILVGKRCVKFLRDVRDSKEHDGKWARKCLSMLREDGTHTMVDTLGNEMLKICHRNAHLRSLFVVAHKFVREQLRHVEDSGDKCPDAPKLVERYRKLLDYFEEYAPRWRSEFREVREAEESGVNLPDVFGDRMP